MSGSASANADRMLELLADRATEGIDAEQTAALNEWLAAHPELDADTLDRTAAQIALALVPVREEALPGSLRARLSATAETFFSNIESSSNGSSGNGAFEE